MESNCEVTIILLGESDVGKTSLLLRFVENKFRDTLSRTTVNKYEKVIKIAGNLVKLILWDTAGRKEYNDFVKNYYNVADGVLLVYDIKNPNTFFELSKWLTDLKSVNQNAEIFIAGNKSDDESNRSVNLADLENFIRNKKIDCIEVSAKLNKNVNILFYYIVQKVLDAKRIMKYPKDSRLIEKSKSFLSWSSITPEPRTTVNASSTLDACNTTEPIVSCVASIEQSTSRASSTSCTTESFHNFGKSAEKNSSSTINTSKTTKPLIRSVESIEKNVSSASNTSSTTESPLNCVKSLEENTTSAINTPNITASLNTCVESTENPSNMLESSSNMKTNVKLLDNEIYEIEDVEDRPEKAYGNSSYSIGHSNFYYPRYYNFQGRISDQDSRLVDSGENAVEFFTARGENSSRDKFSDWWLSSIHLSK